MLLSQDKQEWLEIYQAMCRHEAQEKKEWLARREMKRKARRAKRPRGPPLPLEIADRILSYIPTKNQLMWNEKQAGKPDVYVVGLLLHAIYNPSLLSPHFHYSSTSPRELKDIARGSIKRSLLEDASLADQFKLRIENCESFSSLRPFVTYPHRWKRLEVKVQDPNEDFIELFEPCFSCLEELDIRTVCRMMPGIVLPLQKDSRLKTANLSFNIFSCFFDTGILNFITSLSLCDINESYFPDQNALKEALDNLPHMLSQLPYLYELSIGRMMGYEHHDLAGTPRVKSASLHSLDVDGSYGQNIIAFLNLFADCRIDCISVKQHLLRDVEGLFSDAQYIHVKVCPK